MSHPAIMEITPCWKWEWQDMAQNKDQTSKASLEGEGLKVIEWDVTVPALKMKWNTRKTLPQELIKVWRNGSKEDPLKEMAFKQEKIQNFSLESKHLRWNVVSFPKVLYTVKLTAFRSGEQQKKKCGQIYETQIHCPCAFNSSLPTAEASPVYLHVLFKRIVKQWAKSPSSLDTRPRR